MAWLNDAEQRADLDKAATLFKTELGETPDLFAFPYGEMSLALRDNVAEAGFAAAFGQHSGAVGPGSDLRALPRFPMAEAFAGLDDFRDKVRALPMPVESATPWSPITENPSPLLAITLKGDLPSHAQLACYASGQGRIAVQWDESGRRFTTQAGKPPTGGRTRYNCTAPSGTAGRYYWYSHPWIVGAGPR